MALLTSASLRAESAPNPPPAKPAETTVDTDALYAIGQQLFDQYAPPEVKAEYDFPTKAQWDAFLPKLNAALQGDSLDDLAEYAGPARAVLTTMRAAGADPDLTDWLEQRLDEAEAAQQIRALARPAPPSTPAPTPTPRPTPRPAPVPTPKPPPTTPARAALIPYYDLWLGRVKTRPTPERAAELMPVLHRAFVAEGIPPALAWIAEAESSLNPAARSPSGAKGLFQLMPDTAKRLGLGTFLPDERANPEKSARAAARYLRELHDKFGSWTLALAAYNAGEGRVARTLAKRKAKDYAAIADALPAETRMYVPKVCALVAVRTGRSVANL